MKAKLDNYRIFFEVAKHLSFSKASEALYISQPAISQSIKQLERTLDCSLFFRHAKGVTLTKEGETLFSYVENALDGLEVAEKKLEEIKNLEEGTLIIGAADTIASNLLLPHLEEYHALYPSIKIEVFNRTSIEILEMVKNGTVDLAFVNLPLYDADLDAHPLFAIHDIFVCGINENTKDKYTREEIAKLPLILLEKKSNSRLYVEQQFKRSHVQLTPSIELGAHELLLQFAKIHLGVSCVIKEFSTAYLENNLVKELKLDYPIPERAVGYIHHKRFPLSLCAQQFIQLIKKNARFM